jgi:hypothetical protein
MEFINHGRVTNYMLPVLAIDQIQLLLCRRSSGNHKKELKPFPHKFSNFRHGSEAQNTPKACKISFSFRWWIWIVARRKRSNWFWIHHWPQVAHMCIHTLRSVPGGYPLGRWRARSGEIQLWNDSLSRKQCCPEHHDQNRVLFKVHPNAGAFPSQFQKKVRNRCPSVVSVQFFTSCKRGFKHPRKPWSLVKDSYQPVNAGVIYHQQ